MQQSRVRPTRPERRSSILLEVLSLRLAIPYLAREAFGADVAEHYLHFIKTEQRKFDEVVTSWERERYFERA